MKVVQRGFDSACRLSRLDTSSDMLLIERFVQFCAKVDVPAATDVISTANLACGSSSQEDAVSGLESLKFMKLIWQFLLTSEVYWTLRCYGR